MRLLVSCALLGACGPIYPQQSQPPPPPPPQGGPAGEPSGPPGMTGPAWAGPETGEGAPAAPQPMREPPPPPRGPAPAPALSPDTQQLVDAHNAARARHCAPPLTWSPVLAQAAQRWANNLRDRNCAFEHSPNNRYGENLAGGTTGYLDPNGVVAMWYEEVGKYDFGRPGFSMETGHFTQVVWRGTTQVGCARSTCGAQHQDIWVCEYDPPGNWEGQYPDNVLPTSCRR